MGEGLAIILSAPSGTGKTTICKVLRKKLPDLKFAVSHTTRPIRKGEKDGVDYTFISNEEFEWAKVHNCYYGTSLQSAETPLKKGYDTLLELDIQGVKTLRDMKYQGVYILIFPPSVKELEARLKKRGTDSKENIHRRIETGKKEIKKYKMYDYVITNNEVEDTVTTFLSILQAEKSRVSLYKPTSPDIEELLKDGVD